jgi:hypothetical protein
MKMELINKYFNYLSITIPVLMILFSTLLFVKEATDSFLPQPVDTWRPYRNVIIAIYLIILVIFLLQKFLTKKPIGISLKKWTIGLILSVFSYAIGGFIVDLMRVVMIFTSKVQGI